MSTDATIATPRLFPVSQWYPALAVYSFPTLFVALSADERAALAAGQADGPAVAAVVRRLDRAIASLPGSCFVHADVCAPKDAPGFAAHDGAVRRGAPAWALLASSERVRTAVRLGQTATLAVRPFRRMDHVREFRLFFKDRRVVAMSQMLLLRHFARLHGRQAELWQRANDLAAEIGARLPAADLVVDVYLTSRGALMLVDCNPWGPPTDPLLLRTWDQPWSPAPGLKLIPPPTKLKGDVSVSF